MIKGILDRWLDARLGGGKTPNLPSRLVGCKLCNRTFNVNDLSKTCGHNLEIQNETLWNYLRSLRS